MRVDPSNTRAQAQMAVPKAAERKPKPAQPPKPKPPIPKPPATKSPVPQQARAVTPSRPPPLPSSQPVLRPTHSSSFSQADLYGSQQGMQAAPQSFTAQKPF